MAKTIQRAAPKKKTSAAKKPTTKKTVTKKASSVKKAAPKKTGTKKTGTKKAGAKKTGTKKTGTKKAPVKKKSRGRKTQSKKIMAAGINTHRAAITTTSVSHSHIRPHTSHPSLSRKERNWAMYTHLAALVGFIIPFVGNIIGPLIVWLTKREEFQSIDRHGKEALNFQISMSIYFLAAYFLTFVIIGFILMPVLVIIDLACVVMAAMKAQEGRVYHYPFTIHFLK